MPALALPFAVFTLCRRELRRRVRKRRILPRFSRSAPSTNGQHRQGGIEKSISSAESRRRNPIIHEKLKTGRAEMPALALPFAVFVLGRGRRISPAANTPTLAAGVQAPRCCAGDANSRKGARGAPGRSRFGHGAPKEKRKNERRMVFVFFSFGDPWENRTPVTAVKGRCLNLLTNGPGSGSRI